MRTVPRLSASLLLISAVAGVTACAPATSGGPSRQPTPVVMETPVEVGPSSAEAIATARADSVRYPYTAADIRFMAGMIGHHAQAIEMARWAPTHGASATIRTLAGRIINAQQDEITTMQRWLRDRNQPLPVIGPTTGTATTGAAMAGMDHSMHDMAAMPGMAGMDHALMPGMLSPTQMQQLDAAHGPAFDELFLRFMIQHHEGATAMVTTLFATDGAGQDLTVFKFASDVNVDQSTEIARMRKMLFALQLEKAK